MIDFSKWESLWDTYQSGGHPVLGTTASMYMGWGCNLAVIGLIGLVAALVFSSDEIMFSRVTPARKKRVAKASLAVLVSGVILVFASYSMPSHAPRTSEPPALDTQIVRTWGLDELDGCRKTNMNPLEWLVEDGLPDSGLRDGDWKCVAYRDGRRFDATVHVKGHKVGLYTSDGRELKPAGKDK